MEALHFIFLLNFYIAILLSFGLVLLKCDRSGKSICMIQYNRDIQNTFGMKVRAAAYAEWRSVDALRELLKDSSLPRPFLFVGAGSNLLFTGDFPGTVFHSVMKDIKLLSSEDVCSDGAVMVEAGAGVVFDDFCEWAAERGLWGIENLSHIPGEVGASAVQNVGAYGVEAKDVIVRVNCIELATGKTIVFANSDCGYGYRASNFKTKWKGHYVITSVVFRLCSVPQPRLDYGHLRTAVEENLAKKASLLPGDCPEDSAIKNGDVAGEITPSVIREVVTSIRREKLPEPEELGSAGSFFKNPVIPQSHYEKILSDYRAAAGPEAKVPHYIVGQPDCSAPMIKIPAAWMIEQCGWKGKTLGNVASYAKQPLVIVNLTGKATPQEVIALENAIIASVRDRFAIELHPEVEHI